MQDVSTDHKGMTGEMQQWLLSEEAKAFGAYKLANEQSNSSVQGGEKNKAHSSNATLLCKVGLLSSDKKVCCVSSCTKCGGVGCLKGCCMGVIKLSQKACVDFSDTSCVMPTRRHVE